MIAIKETSIPLNYNLDDESTKRAVSIANALVSELNDGEYLIKNKTFPTIFVRNDRWTRELAPESFELKEFGIIKFNDSTGIVLSKEEFDTHLKNSLKCRLVLLSEFGFSSFLVDLEKLQS